MDGEEEVHVYNRILPHNKEKRNYEIYMKMNGIGKYYTEGGRPGLERQTPYVCSRV